MQRRLSDGFDIRPVEPRAPILLASGTHRSSFLSSISYDATFISPPLDPLFRRPRLPTRSARGMGPDRKLYPPALPPHLALCVFIPSRHCPPSYLPHRRPLPLRGLGQLEPDARHLRQSQSGPTLLAPNQGAPGSLGI